MFAIAVVVGHREHLRFPYNLDYYIRPTTGRFKSLLFLAFIIIRTMLNIYRLMMTLIDLYLSSTVNQYFTVTSRLWGK